MRPPIDLSHPRICKNCGIEYWPTLKQAKHMGYLCPECFRLRGLAYNLAARRAKGSKPRNFTAPREAPAVEIKIMPVYGGPADDLKAEYSPPKVRYCLCCGRRLTEATGWNFCDEVCQHNFEVSRQKPLPTPFIRVEMPHRSH
jgi:hypothetical protein